MNHHSNPFSSQQNPRRNVPVGNNSHQSGAKTHQSFSSNEIVLATSNYRQIPIRTLEVENKLNHLKQKFEPHLTKTAPHPQQIPANIPVRKVVKPQINNFETTVQPNSNRFTINPVAPMPTNTHQLPSKKVYTPNNQFQTTLTHKILPVNNANINKIYSQSYQEQLNPLPKKSIFPINKGFNSIKTKKSSRFIPRFRNHKVTASIMIFLISATLFSVSGFFYYQRNLPSQTAVAGVVENKIEYPKLDEYKTWITEQNGSYSEPQEDVDQDQINNYEEFLINSNPLSANTCDPEKTDSQNLFNFIDPATCKPINFEDEQETKKFEELITFPDLKEGFLIDNQELVTDTQPTNTANLLSFFNIQNFSDLESISIESLDTQVSEKNTKKEYLRLIGRIESYINQFRSYEANDRNYPVPVHPAVFLDVSLRYQVPLKYTLAIARTESRFGTDRYTASGNLTRPGEHQNIYSMGLTDGGKNITFNSWEAGVESFGKWYKKFQDRGISNCSKWKIYNPNGDYCSKVEKLAASIEIYLESN